MKKYESYDVCKNCGQTYGRHRWKDDACPKSICEELNIVQFDKIKKFEHISSELLK